MHTPDWSFLRGRNDGENWATAHATLQELVAWADISDFEYYMGLIPFPYDNPEAVRCYETAKSGAQSQGLEFSHQHYVSGFLGAVHDECVKRLHMGR
jgi:hypothetical protein